MADEKKKDIGNELAFPMTPSRGDGLGDDIYGMGLTKREYFVAMAMQGVMSSLNAGYSDEVPDGIRPKPPEFISGLAVKVADALIKELSK